MKTNIRPYITIALALLTFYTITPIVQAVAGTVLSEDFTTDPGWVSTDPVNVRWDPAGFYRTRVNDENYVPRWGYSPVFPEVADTSFILELDMRPADPAWGTYPLFALNKKDSGNPYIDPPLKIEVHWSSSVTKVFILRGSGLSLPSGRFSPRFDPLTWYHHKVSYNSTTGDLSWVVTIRDTGIVFHSLYHSGVAIKPFNEIAVGFEGLPPVYGSWAEIFVDSSCCGNVL